MRGLRLHDGALSSLGTGIRAPVILYRRGTGSTSLDISQKFHNVQQAVELGGHPSLQAVIRLSTVDFFDFAMFDTGRAYIKEYIGHWLDMVYLPPGGIL